MVRAELQTTAVQLAEEAGDVRGIVKTGKNKKVVVEVEVEGLERISTN